ncbi:hypothetical protein [Burkholderia sp. Leaf177]|uniref:hypothetical protein n=1 Tax=Burkholderia sp. Leaf177 TaxID=1736287 RepID=UPI0012E396F3|nr:hypothetical protein [Burkholderia sp. Leaf177]
MPAGDWTKNIESFVERETTSLAKLAKRPFARSCIAKAGTPAIDGDIPISF